MCRPTVALLSLGCAKNLVDSEHIASLLECNGVRVVHQAGTADVVIVNTCGFIDPAKQESVDAILDVAEDLAHGAALIVTGCLSQRYGEQLRDLLPEVDAFVGLDPELTARRALESLGIEPREPAGFLRSRALTPTSWSYLRIAEGCDNRCAYCAIPTIRGPLCSRPREQLEAEARLLAARGVRELNIIAQDTTAWGLDRFGEPRLHELLRDLCAIDELRWVRVLYMHPAHIYDELIDLLAAEPKICPYVDVPLQHVSDRILQAMGRAVSRGRIEDLLNSLRSRIPGVTLRTTFIVGFPGETEDEFEDLLGFVRQQHIERVGCFAYSREEGTPAADMAPQVPQDMSRARVQRLMSAQQQIAFALAAERAGERTSVLIEEAVDQGTYVGRSPHEAPDVDPVIYVASQRALEAGRFIDAEIVGSEGYDCLAVDLEGGDESEG